MHVHDNNNNNNKMVTYNAHFHARHDSEVSPPSPQLAYKRSNLIPRVRTAMESINSSQFRLVQRVYTSKPAHALSGRFKDFLSQ
jgi:hypothetical protein